LLTYHFVLNIIVCNIGSDVVLGDLHVVHTLQNLNQAVGTVLGTTLGNVGVEELSGLGHAGEGNTHALALVKSNAEILNEMFDVETGEKVSLEDAGSEASKLEAAGGALAEELDHLVEVEARLLAVDKGLADTEKVVCDHDLVGSLGVLTSASLTHKLNLSGVHVEEGTDMVNMILCATDHGDELAVLGTDITTRDWCVNAVDTETLGLLSHAHVEGRAGGGVVNKERAFLHVSEETVLLVKDHGFDVTGVSKHDEKVVSLLSDLNWAHESGAICDKGVAGTLEAIRNLKG